MSDDDYRDLVGAAISDIREQAGLFGRSLAHGLTAEDALTALSVYARDRFLRETRQPIVFRADEQ